MASFKFDGIDYISASLEQLSNISDAEKMSIIRPAAEFLKTTYENVIRSKFRQRSGALADSITVEQRSDEAGAYAHVAPKGKHPGSSTGKRKRRNGRSNGRYSGTNEEVAYILNYGSPRIAATHWMENANEEAADQVVAIQQEKWDELITQKGL